MKYAYAIAVTLFPCLLIGCDSHKEAAVYYDYSHQPLPFEKPLLIPALSFPEAPTLSAQAQETVDLLRAFFAHDFAVVDEAIYESHRRYSEREVERHPARFFLSALEDTKLAGIDACEGWTSSMPDSYAAHWVCGRKEHIPHEAVNMLTRCLPSDLH